MNDVSSIAAWAGLASALVAIAAILVESRRARLATGVDLLMRLTNQFDSAEMRETRKRAAIGLRSHAPDKANPIFDFFEMVGYFVKRGILDKEASWFMFGYWVCNYWSAASSHIRDAQAQDPTLWSDFEYLYGVACDQERRGRIRAFPAVVPAQSIAKFLDEEADL